MPSMGKLARQIQRNRVRKELEKQGKKMCNRDNLRARLRALGIPYWEDELSSIEFHKQQIPNTGDTKSNKSEEEK